MAFGTRVQFDAVRELAFGSISGTYTALGSATTDRIRILCVNNSTDVSVYISMDGETNALLLAPNSFRLFDFSTNKIRDDGFFLPIGTIFYVKQASVGATKGTVWAEVAYAIGGV